MDQLIGKTLDRYKILSLLGEGGMGAVYKARDLTLQREVAIKIMHSQFARQKNFQQRFLQEARTAARLDHPGIVQVYDFSSAQSLLYIVMEFIPGANLQKLLKDLKKRGNWIILNEAVLLIQQVSLALDYAHRHGVLHRDIKPANVMLEPETSGDLPYRPVLTDLGLAKLAGGGIVTQSGSFMGTPAYMSPEQALGETTDARSDVYSLGILLYEMAVGRLPFPVRTITEAIRFHTKEPPPPPRSIRPDLPVELETIILKTIEKNPDDRFTNAAALADALGQLSPDATEVAPVTAVLEAEVSLMTQYQQSLVEQRGPSIFSEFPETPDSLSQDRIQVMMKDKTTLSVSFKSGGMTIGRDDDNDIVIDDTQASRVHARIEFEGSNYRVVDLDSTNGTYLANAKLLPGVPEVWMPDAALRIGSSWLRLNRAQAAASSSTTATFDPTMVLSSDGEGRVGIFMETTNLQVEPGSSMTTSIVLLNQGVVVDHFQVSVSGIPAPWIPSQPAPIQLMPGQQQEIKLTIQPPRAHHSQAGRYPITIRVSSQDNPSEIAELKSTLTVAAYSQFTSELHPQSLKAGKNARITVNNQGNIIETFTFNFQDRAEELAFKPRQAQLQVPGGQMAVAEFNAAPRKRRWFGRQHSHPFTVKVAPSTGESQTQSGEVLSQGLIPMWLPPLLIILCVVLAAAAGIYYNSVQNARATELAFSEAQSGTATALAMTAIAEGDDDQDGLSNNQEIGLGTDPNNPDTDGDGLSDGVEVNQFGTQPNNQDSDGDTLLDGEEVNMWNTSPINADTDGDGLNDGIEILGGSNPLMIDTDGDGLSDSEDPAPLHTSTPTPDLNATEQAIANMTATAAALAAEAAGAATNATATAQMAATQTVQALQPIAYIYNTDINTANQYKNLLGLNGYIVDLVKQSTIPSKDFSSYRFIIVGPDTDGAHANTLNSAGPRIIGLGEGGYALFGQLNLKIGWPKGAHGSGTTIYVVDPPSSYWSSPNNISVPGSRVISLYNSSSGYVVIHYPDPISGISGIGKQSAGAVHYPIISQGKYLLWGFDKGPSSMTATGQDVFINMVKTFTTMRLQLFLDPIIFNPIIIVTLQP